MQQSILNFQEPKAAGIEKLLVTTRSEEFTRFISLLLFLQSNPLPCSPCLCVNCWLILGQLESQDHLAANHQCSVQLDKLTQVLDASYFKQMAVFHSKKHSKRGFYLFGVSELVEASLVNAPQWAQLNFAKLPSKTAPLLNEVLTAVEPF